MKIKTIKKLNLHELIKHVWENDVEDTYFFSNEKLPSGQKVKLHVNPRDFDYGESGKKAGVSLKSHGFVVDDSYTFTVEVKEDLTEETELSGVTTFIRKSNGIFPVYTASASIRDCLDSLTDVENEPLKIFNGITEIWNKDTGIPESGALEVDVE